MNQSLLAISPNRAFGQAGALLSFAAAIVGILCGWWGLRTRNEALLRQLPRYAYLAFGGAVLSVAMMQRALATRDWEVAYVQQVGSDLTPTFTTSPRCGRRSKARSRSGSWRATAGTHYVRGLACCVLVLRPIAF